MIDGGLYTARLQDGHDIVVGEQSPGGGAPDVYTPAIRNQQVDIHTPKGSPDSRHSKAKIAGEENRGVPSGVPDSHETGRARKREHPEQRLYEFGCEETEFRHAAVPGFAALPNGSALTGVE
jgi:hypothetical protein